MATTKNFGLAGVGADVQFGKGNGRLVAGEGVFRFTSNGTTLVNARVAAPTDNDDAATKEYVDDGLDTKLNLAGGTLTGALILAADPTTDLEAATKQYVDDADALKLNLTGGTLTGNLSLDGNSITNLATPVAATDAANKSYVDSVASGLSIKQAVRVATTENITLSGNPTIDGVTVADGDRVLVKNQNAPAENGIYVVDGALENWVRATDFDEPGEITGGEFVFVKEGTSQADTGWVVATPNSEIGTIGTDPIVWVQFSAAGVIQAGDGLTQTGNTFNVVGTAGRIVANADSIDLATTAVAAGEYGDAASAVTFTVDAYGRITAASEAAIAITASQVTDFTTAAQATISGSTAGAGVDVAVVAGVVSADLDFVGLTAESAIADADLLVFYDDTAAAYRKITAAELKTYAQSGLSQSQITDGDSSVVVSDTGTGVVTVTVDATTSATFSASGADVVGSFTAGTLAADSLTEGRVVYVGTSGQLVDSGDFTYDQANDLLIVGNVSTTDLVVGNLNLNGNTISSTDTDGDINLVPNGAGQVVIGGAGAGVIATDTDEDLAINAGGALTFSAEAGTAGAFYTEATAGDIETWLATAGDLAIPTKGYVDAEISDAISGSALTAGDGIDITTGTISVDLTAASGLKFTGGDLEVDLVSGDLALSTNAIGLADVGTAVTDQFVKITTDAKGRVTATSAVDGADIRGTSAYSAATGELTLGGTGEFGLADVTDGGTGSFVKISRDAKGRVTGTTAVVESDITGLVDSVYINTAGDTMTGALILSNDTPSTDLEAAAKGYVDAQVASVVAGGLSGTISSRAVAVPFTSLTSINIGAVLPTGAVVVRVLLSVGTASDAATTVAVLSDATTIMATGENDPESTGIYVADAYHLGGGEQLTAVVGGTAGSVGSANVIVEYRNA